ncbi:putative disease resistance protein RGA3 [Salvia divinorum]|uniref:Disease resistance protein RGA3 n=1 Tax=Salvia divinorum TaxID=28513 RepID=A0ABD1G3E3_SALDI
MAYAIISAVGGRVTNLINDQIQSEWNLVRDVKKELHGLSGTLSSIKNVLDDAEKRGVNDQSVKNWLKKLIDTAYEMDDILDEWNYTLIKHKMDASAHQMVQCSFIPSPCLCFKKVCDRRDTAKKMQNVKAALDHILKEMNDFKFVIALPTTDHISKSSKIQSTSSIAIEQINGVDIDRNKNDLVSNLRLNDDSQILCIVGMGGIGKTTLAQLVYNDTQVKDCFELQIWICVSDPFDVAGVARGIVESVGIETITPNTNQLELVLQKLKASILGKKFLLVLDDVWTEDNNKWEPLKINLKHGAPRSKILVTTRNERVAMMMGTLDKDIYRPKPLSDEECWSLLRRISLLGRSEEKCGDFEEVGKKIASKCKGLPLAANVLGSFLQFKYNLEEWENVENSEIWQLENAKVELFPHFILSYNELSPSLKHCFSYCAIYPKDSHINVESLMEEWLALGYLGSVSGNSGVELKGREYLNILAMRSLLQDFEKTKYGEQIVRCKMHDIAHDFTMFLRKNDDREKVRRRSCQGCDHLLVSQAQEYRSLFWDRRSPPNLCNCLISVRVLKFKRDLCIPLPQGMQKLIHLRWLGLSGTYLNEEDLKIICKLYFLQTLLLSFCSLIKIPSEIGDLIHLRNLDLSDNEFIELPVSMCSLVELQILDIQRCKQLCKLPKEINMLRNLQYLLIQGTPAKLGILEAVGKLTGLRTLGGNRRDGLGRVSTFHVGNGGDIIHVQSLEILFIPSLAYDTLPSSPELWMDVIKDLEPYQKLDNLVIERYKGCALPHWMSSSLNLIKHIHLLDFHHVSSLTHMGKLPLLEDLYLEGMPNMEFLGREFLGLESSTSSSSNHVAVFPKLKKLKFFRWYSWLEWEDITVEEEKCMHVSIMPCLTQLIIKLCSSLEKLPHCLLRKSSSLQIIDITHSTKLEKCYGDKEGSPWRSISQHNPQLVLRPS